jgi:zinc/manganese transport system substrate-binding protein
MAHRTSVLIVVTLALVSALGAGCSSENESAGGRPAIVVTHAILGSVVEDLAGEVADVEVLMPNGADPHDFQPSAKDIERLRGADLVVANGLGLEESLDEALDQARSDGHRLFTAGDHVEVRLADGADDPHFWTDPAQMKTMAAALAAMMQSELGLDVSAQAAAAADRLEALDEAMDETLAPIPSGRRKLVTGHESMGYFADRFGFEYVGAVVPGLSTQAGVSASELADLKAVIAKEGVDVVFAEAGTPRQVTDAIAGETGARVVEIPAHALPDDGSYETLMRETAQLVAGALSS